MTPTDLTAGRLHLRPWEAADVPDLAALLDDPDVARWTPHPSPFTLQHAEERIAQDAAHWEQGTRAELGVRDATTGELLGTAGLYRCTDREAEVGWGIGAATRGQGVATDAVRAVCGWALHGLGLERLDARILVGNWASRRVAEKAGFTFEGTCRAGAAEGSCWVLSRLATDEGADTAAFPPYAPVSDGVVTLRRWRSSDAADVARACSDRETARWLPVPVPYTVDTGLAYIDGIVPQQWFDGARANVAVVDATSGGLLGAVGLAVQRDVGAGEVGYWTAPWARGRGVAGRAARLQCDWGFAALGLARVELLAGVGNLASQRAAEKAGFVREGVARGVRPAPRSTDRTDMVVFARVR